MHKKSCNSVKVSYLKSEDVLPRLRQAVARLKQNPNVLRVYLFGSFVKGNQTPGSDADVSIILKEDKRRIMDRIPEYLDYFSEVGVAVDVFPYTVAETERMKASNNSMLREILTSGVEL